MTRKVTRQERGYAGHFICSMYCAFRRNTLLTCGKTRVVVSTVGNYRPKHENGQIETIGVGRYYETMAFRAIREAPYWEANVSKEISLISPWRIDEIKEDSDAKADAMHERIVRELSIRMIQRKL